MYVVIEPYDPYLELTIGKSANHDHDENFDHDYNLLVDGIAAQVYRRLNNRIHMRPDGQKWILLFDLKYNNAWKKDLEAIFEDLRLNFHWKYSGYLECQVNQYLGDRQ